MDRISMHETNYTVMYMCHATHTHITCIIHDREHAPHSVVPHRICALRVVKKRRRVPRSQKNCFQSSESNFRRIYSTLLRQGIGRRIFLFKLNSIHCSCLEERVSLPATANEKDAQDLVVVERSYAVQTAGSRLCVRVLEHRLGWKCNSEEGSLTGGKIFTSYLPHHLKDGQATSKVLRFACYQLKPTDLFRPPAPRVVDALATEYYTWSSDKIPCQWSSGFLP